MHTSVFFLINQESIATGNCPQSEITGVRGEKEWPVSFTFLTEVRRVHQTLAHTYTNTTLMLKIPTPTDIGTYIEQKISFADTF